MTRYQHFADARHDLYARLRQDREAIRATYEVMAASPCGAAISAYEDALDAEKATRVKIGQSHDAEMAQRGKDAGL